MSKALLTALLSLALAATAATAGEAAPEPLRVLIVTGGHGFNRKAFFQVFKSLDGVEFTEARQGKTATAYDREDLLTYDAVVLYDMVQGITDEQKKRFLALTEKGVGLVVLHHALASYQAWPAYEEIVGGKFLLRPGTVDGKTIKRSGTGWGDLTLHVVSKDHPVTQGMDDFTWHDEYYNRCRVADDVTVLLTTECPGNQKQVAWCREHGKSRVVYFMSGHDQRVYNRPEYRRIVGNAIRWAARRH